MTTLFTTLARDEAQAVLDGRMSLSQVHQIETIAAECEDNVFLSDQMTPPLAEQLIMQIDLEIDDAALAERVVPFVDLSEVIYDVPRARLNRATFRLVTDAELLAFCTENLDYTVPPGHETLRSMLIPSIASSDTEDISPHYLRAFHAAPHLTLKVFPERLCIHHSEGGAAYVAEKDGRYYVILDERTTAYLLNEEDLKEMDLLKLLPFDSNAEREAYLKQRFGAQS